MPVKFCIQNVFKSLLKCGMHFVYKCGIPFAYKCGINFVYIQIFCIHFVHKSLSKCRIHFVYIQTFCIHFVYISSDLQKVYIINIMYTICIQNSYRMYMQRTVCRMDSSQKNKLCSNQVKLRFCNFS